MSSPRKALRAAVVSRLTGATAAADRVWAGRAAPFEEVDLPAIHVHTRDQENVEDHPASGWNGYTTRRCIVMIDGCVQAYNDAIDDTLDDLAEQIETMLESWEIPGFESSEIRQGSTSSEVDWDGAAATGWVHLSYEVRYRKAYRDCSNPYVQADPDNIYRSGAYPGGQVVAGCPADQTGEVCPIGTAELFSQEEPIN